MSHKRYGLFCIPAEKRILSYTFRYVSLGFWNYISGCSFVLMLSLDLAVGRAANIPDDKFQREGESCIFGPDDNGVLQSCGHLVFKLLESEDTKELSQICKPLFKKASWLRPKATSSRHQAVLMFLPFNVVDVARIHRRKAVAKFWDLKRTFHFGLDKDYTPLYEELGAILDQEPTPNVVIKSQPQML
ncbi:hypothetical protein REPUB_Repub03eG0212500 [Reevesia pubescens]